MYILPIKRNEIFWLLTKSLFFYRNFIRIKIDLNIVHFQWNCTWGENPLTTTICPNFTSKFQFLNLWEPYIWWPSTSGSHRTSSELRIFKVSCILHKIVKLGCPPLISLNFFTYCTRIHYFWIRSCYNKLPSCVQMEIFLEIFVDFHGF